MIGRRALGLFFLLTLPLVTPRIRGADEIEYFAYLRSAFFDQDLEFGNEYQHFYERDPEGLAGFKATFLDLREPVTGRHINFAPLGTALLWSPFYLLAHGAASTAARLGLPVERDGYSRPYVAAACYASAIYGFLGLLLMWDALRRSGTSEPAATWATAALWFGTPLLYYMTIAPGFSHACSLFAVALLFWLWIRTRTAPAGPVAEWLAIGAAGGLCGLVREQDVLFLVVPAADLLGRVLRRTVAPFGFVVRGFALGLGAVAVFSPQFLAYHATNGSYGPSKLVARKMAFTSPHFLEVLFDPGHGLFAWTPLVLLAVIGLLAALIPALRSPSVERPGGGPVPAPPAALIALAFLLQVWINGSVESWTQAGAFGSRRFVATTPVFAWGLAALVALALRRGRHWGRKGVAAALLLGVWWNLSLMVQFGLRLMDRQTLEWPRVAVNQVTEVPRRIGSAAVLFFTDRERLVREAR